MPPVDRRDERGFDSAYRTDSAPRLVDTPGKPGRLRRESASSRVRRRSGQKVTCDDYPPVKRGTSRHPAGPRGNTPGNGRIVEANAAKNLCLKRPPSCACGPRRVYTKLDAEPSL